MINENIKELVNTEGDNLIQDENYPSEDEIDEETLKEISEVTKEYEENPNSLEVGKRLSKIYIKLGKISSLRSLMNNLNDLYTLPESNFF